MLHSHPLLRQHPLLFSLFLMSGALFLIIASFNADSIFPMFTLIGVSPALLCLLLGVILGISGSLTGIIGVLEHLDHPSDAITGVAHMPVFIAQKPARSERLKSPEGDTPNYKEHRYDCN